MEIRMLDYWFHFVALPFVVGLGFLANYVRDRAPLNIFGIMITWVIFVMNLIKGLVI